MINGDFLVSPVYCRHNWQDSVRIPNTAALMDSGSSSYYNGPSEPPVSPPLLVILNIMITNTGFTITNNVYSPCFTSAACVSKAAFQCCQSAIVPLLDVLTSINLNVINLSSANNNSLGAANAIYAINAISARSHQRHHFVWQIRAPPPDEAAGEGDGQSGETSRRKEDKEERDKQGNWRTEAGGWKRKMVQGGGEGKRQGDGRDRVMVEVGW
ncbi:hypothetical protein Pmani_024357 [Petrolisthes manimaculis]|uniref:Uncharacterized protein n=1 Tax=Petrolisthes manimaculis TaxID=1843537 RepID=A0AAE1P8E1_9EUCA|nr:hypothetical protein Pmani_024357 [Petrolisthes manimaculis]